MKKITKFDSASLNVLRPVLDGAIKKALAPYGLKGRFGSIKYHNTNFTASVTVATLDNGRQSYLELVKDSKYREASVKARWFGKTFRYNNDEYRIVGGNSGRKYDVETVRVRDNRLYSFPSQLVCEAFDGKAAKAA